MAYNLESFLQILGQDQYHLIMDCNDNIESLLAQTRKLREFVDNPPAGIQILDSRIRDAVHKAEDIIESYIIDQAGQSQQLDLTGMLMEFVSIMEEMNICAVVPLDGLPSAVYSLEEPDGPAPSSDNEVVGFDVDLEQLIDQLTIKSSHFQVIPIVGMGGMGKTTLARLIYNHTTISHHFDICAWTKISQNFDSHRTFLSLLLSLNSLTNEMHKEEDDKLGLRIYQTLKGRRYLIVVDDIWNPAEWDTLKQYLPDDENGSRIVVTTRSDSIGNHVSSKHSYVHKMHLLSVDDSWKLLIENVFGQECCPTEFKELGTKITDFCGGLPLAIISLAGILSKSEKTQLFWASLGKSLRSETTNIDLIRCREILSMSYNHLPYYLKPCFLYVGAFPEDNEIRASKIIKLWVAEGIIKPIGNNTLEDVAEVYLSDLIDRNLLSVCQQDPDGKVRTFKIHHLLRELCQRKAVDEKFLWFRNSDDLEIPENEGMRRMSVHPSYQPCDETECRLLVRSFLCFGLASSQLAPLFFYSRLLRVLDVFQIEFLDFPAEIEQLMNLRYLGLSCRSSHLPSSIFKFQNLQTLKISLPFNIISPPCQLWEMTQLKHVQFKKTCIQYCPEDGQTVTRENLETLSNVETSKITELLQRTPYLRKLGIYCDSPVHSTIDLACLERLERLNCSSVWPSVHHFLSQLILPHSLKKLTLNFCKIPPGFITYVGSLISLEQLKLKNSDFVDTEEDPVGTKESKWIPVEGGFQKLISLSMENLNLRYWWAESFHFPILQHLIIHGCDSLEEIPSDFGDINTLERIEVDEFNTSVRDSALKIQEEINNSGNLLEVVVHRAC